MPKKQPLRSGDIVLCIRDGSSKNLTADSPKVKKNRSYKIHKIHKNFDRSITWYEVCETFHFPDDGTIYGESYLFRRQ